MSPAAEQAVEALRAAGATVATAESLTGGLLCAALVDVPGASEVVRGGVVAYAADVKADVLGVDGALVTSRGTVDPDVAAAMAERAALLCAATWGVSTTGVAGPDPSEGHPVGTAFVGIAGPTGTTVQELHLCGDRRGIREQVVGAALSSLVARVGEESTTAHG